MSFCPRHNALRVLVSLLALHLASAVSAQDASGKVQNWPGGAADLLFWQVGKVPRVAGRVTANGTVTLDLPGDVELPQRLSQVFSCADGGETNSNPDLPYAITTTLQYVRPSNAREIKGGVILATTDDVAAHFGNGGPLAAGRSYQWIFTPGTAEITGVCTSHAYPDGKTRFEQTTRLDMSLEAGWNLLEVAVDEIETFPGGVSAARVRSLRIIDAIPTEAQWSYWPE